MTDTYSTAQPLDANVNTLGRGTVVWVDVTISDIARCLRYRGADCPLALAIRRATGRSYVTVGLNVAHIFNAVLLLTQEAIDFAFAFDKGRDVRPQRLYLKVG